MIDLSTCRIVPLRRVWDNREFEFERFDDFLELARHYSPGRKPGEPYLFRVKRKKGRFLFAPAPALDRDVVLSFNETPKRKRKVKSNA